MTADALAIWEAGLAAVRSEHLLAEQIQVQDQTLQIGEEEFDLRQVRRIIVVGAGKAGAGMTIGLEDALGEKLAVEKQLSGWVNVPEDCLRSTRWIHLHAARAAGVNEPTLEGIAGTEQMLRLLSQAGPEDLCICLLSGGGSALLPAPAKGITLSDKQKVTRVLSAAGADIRELNTVRKQLSRVKGGRLAEACHAGTLVTLIISDVLGDPLDLIASGPTVPDTATPADALAVLEKYQARAAGVSDAVVDLLHAEPAERAPVRCRVSNQVIGNNAVAVDAAGMEAERRGYSHAMICANSPEGNVTEVARHLAAQALHMRTSAGPDCLISGGEPTVQLAPESDRGQGGRNQQLVLTALVEVGDGEGVLILSGGTDGEDGPTDAAGGLVQAEVIAKGRELGLDAQDFLRRNDAYNFLKPTGGLIQTGPTHTNVCDLRVVLVDRCELPERA